MDEPKKTKDATFEPLWPAGLVDSLYQTLLKNLPEHKASKEPLTIGIFGEWGSGKSKLLETLAQRFEAALQDKPDERNVPIRFNPWRYEKEDHLIIPLLKSAEAQLQALQTDTLKDWMQQESGAWLKGKIKILGDAALAVGAGMKVSTGFVDIDFGKILAANKKSWLGRSSNASADYSSIYFDLLNHLERLTTEDGPQGQQLRLTLFY